MPKKLNGADLETKVATGGTVVLEVNHAAESYAVYVLEPHYLDDLYEIERYLNEYGFEIMGEDEAPAEWTPTGWRMWACHSKGQVFA